MSAQAPARHAPARPRPRWRCSRRRPAGSRSSPPARPSPPGRDRLLDQLDPERLELVEDPLRPPRGPGGVGVDPDPRLRAERLAHRPHLADVVAGPELQLEGAEARPPPSAPASAATSAGVARDQGRVALHRSAAVAGRARLSPSPGRLLGVLAARSRSQSAVSTAQRAGAESAAAVALAAKPAGSSFAASASASSSRTTASRRRAAAQRQRHRFAEPDQRPRRRAAAAAPSRAASSRPRAVT